MSIERIVAAVVDTQLLTLYREDGSTIEIPQGDPRVQTIVDKVLPVVEQGGVAELELVPPNSYRDFEEQSNGFVRFFKVAKKKLSRLLGTASTAPEGNYGQAPTQTRKAVDQIIKHATPASGDKFRDSALKEDETMVAVVGKGKGQKVVPGVEQIRDQIGYHAKMKNTKGMEELLKRVAKVIDKRRHSIEDLMRFLQHSDLPIADDGSIIAYKVLKNSRRGEKGTFVDCHTGKVTQRVGSYVCVDEKLVDLNRDVECSNGLHIARRGYIGGFGGDVCVLAKVAPEDVMTVPHRDANKVRVKGYHIIFELPSDAFSKLKRNAPMTELSSETTRMLNRAISGDHTPIIQRVEITQQSGGGLVITPVNRVKDIRNLPGAKLDQPAVAPTPATTVGPRKEKPAKVEHTAIDDSRNRPKADPKMIASRQAGSVRQQKAREMADAVMGSLLTMVQRRQTAAELVAFKKAAKVSWTVLGISEREAEIIMATAEAAEVKAPPPPKKQPVEPAPAEGIVPEPAADAEAANEEASKSNLAVAHDLTAKPANVRSRAIQSLLDRYNDKHLPIQERKSAAQGLLEFRRKQKVSWERLGFAQINDPDLRAFIAQEEPVAPAPAPKKPASVAIKGGSPIGEGTSADQARGLYNAHDWTGLAAFKKVKKKSWSALGFSASEIDEIKLHLGD